MQSVCGHHKNVSSPLAPPPALLIAAPASSGPDAREMCGGRGGTQSEWKQVRSSRRFTYSIIATKKLWLSLKNMQMCISACNTCRNNWVTCSKTDAGPPKCGCSTEPCGWLRNQSVNQIYFCIAQNHKLQFVSEGFTNCTGVTSSVLRPSHRVRKNFKKNSMWRIREK